MAVAGMILGIVAIVLSFVPCINLISLLPAVVGLVLSILGLVKSKKTGSGRGMAIAGLVLCILALIWVPLFFFLILGAASASAAEAAAAAGAM